MALVLALPTRFTFCGALAGAAVVAEVERLRKENAGLKRSLQQQQEAQQERRQDGIAQGEPKPAQAPEAVGSSEDADAVRKP